MAATMNVDFQNTFTFMLLCLFSVFLYSFFFKKPKVTYDLPPSPPSLPIIGHLHHLFSTQTHRSLQKLSSNYGSLLHLRIFNIPVLVVSSASTAYEIFKTQDVSVSSRGPSLIDDPIYAGSSSFISSSYGDHWKFMKKVLVTKLLGPQALDRSRQIRADELERLYRSLVDKAKNEESVEIYKDSMKLSTNSICKMIMGRSCSEENGEEEIFMALASESIAMGKKVVLGNMLRAPFRSLVRPLFKKERVALSDRFDEAFERIIVEHEEKRDGHQGTELMDALLAAYGDDNTEHKISRNHIKTFLADLLFAGTESSALASQWAMAHIINNPKIHERLRGEIDSVVGETRLIQETDLPNLPYLQAVVKEILRLLPPATLFGRRLQEGCKIGKYYVPKETSLVVNVYAVMRDPEVWEDPEEFKPERFLVSSRSEEEEDSREKLIKYLPFGSGRRACPGDKLAYLFLGTAVGMMVQCFDWRIDGEKVDMEETVQGLALTMANPPKFKPVARTLNLNSRSS